MASGKVLVIGSLGLGLAALFLFSKDAHAAPGVPAGWNPPPGALRATFPANGPGTISITAAEWQADPGQPPGEFTLFWDPNDLKTFVALFAPAATPAQPAVMAVGTTQNSQLLLSTVPNLIAHLKGTGA